MTKGHSMSMLKIELCRHCKNTKLCLKILEYFSETLIKIWKTQAIVYVKLLFPFLRTVTNTKTVLKNIHAIIHHISYHKYMLYIQYTWQCGKIDKWHNHFQDVKPARNYLLNQKCTQIGIKPLYIIVLEINSVPSIKSMQWALSTNK